MTNDNMIPASISVDWWYGETELEGVAEFKAELSDKYVVSRCEIAEGRLVAVSINSLSSSCLGFLLATL